MAIGRTVTSSEYKDTKEASDIPHEGGGASDGSDMDSDDAEEEPLRARAYEIMPAHESSLTAVPETEPADDGSLPDQKNEDKKEETAEETKE